MVTMSEQRPAAAAPDKPSPQGGPVVTLKSPEVDSFDPAGLGSAAKWASTGFATLTALLTFFGIKDGMLTRILAEEPTASLWALILVGAGVVLSLFGIAVRKDVYLYSAWIFGGIIVMSACSAVLLKDVDEADITDAMLVASFAVLAVGLFWSVLRAHTIALTAGILVLAVSATAHGLYAAAKIAVEARGAPENLRVTVDLTGDSPSRTLEVKLAGAKQDAGIVTVIGYRAERVRNPDTGQPDATVGWPLWESYFDGDDTRTVSETYHVPVDTTRWAEVGIEVCTDSSDDASTDGERPSCEPTERAHYRTDGAERPGAALSGSLDRNTTGRSVTAAVMGRNIPAAQRMIIVVRAHRARGAPLSLTRATAIPNSSGTAKWQADLAVPARRISLHATVCSAPAPEPQARSTGEADRLVQLDRPCRPSGARTVLAVDRPAA